MVQLMTQYSAECENRLVVTHYLRQGYRSCQVRTCLKYSDSEEDNRDTHRMNDTIPSKTASKIAATDKARDWRKSMSDNVAYALLVYTALQIFVTVHAMKDGTKSVLPYFALVVLIAGIIPACRWFERRWRDLSDEDASDMAFAGAYRRDIMGLWILAIGLPFALTGLYKLVAA